MEKKKKLQFADVHLWDVFRSIHSSFEMLQNIRLSECLNWKTTTKPQQVQSECLQVSWKIVLQSFELPFHLQWMATSYCCVLACVCMCFHWVAFSETSEPFTEDHRSFQSTFAWFFSVIFRNVLLGMYVYIEAHAHIHMRGTCAHTHVCMHAYIQ